MLSPEQVIELIGHPVGGVCPFGINKEVTVYLDESLKRFDYVFSACGTSNSAIKLEVEKMKDICTASSWIDVCKSYEKEV